MLVFFIILKVIIQKKIDVFESYFTMVTEKVVANSLKKCEDFLWLLNENYSLRDSIKFEDSANFKPDKIG